MSRKRLIIILLGARRSSLTYRSWGGTLYGRGSIARESWGCPVFTALSSDWPPQKRQVPGRSRNSMFSAQHFLYYRCLRINWWNGINCVGVLIILRFTSPTLSAAIASLVTVYTNHVIVVYWVAPQCCWARRLSSCFMHSKFIFSVVDHFSVVLCVLSWTCISWRTSFQCDVCHTFLFDFHLFWS